MEIYANIGAHKNITHLVHLFSKKKSGMWPNVSAAATRAKNAMLEAKIVNLNEISVRFTTKVQPNNILEERKYSRNFYQKTYNTNT